MSSSVNPKNPDMVNNPPHYQGHPTGIECIDIVEVNPFPNLANVIKYAWRVSWGGKFNDIEDLKKVVWYAEREIARRTTESTPLTLPRTATETETDTHSKYRTMSVDEEEAYRDSEKITITRASLRRLAEKGFPVH